MLRISLIVLTSVSLSLAAGFFSSGQLLAQSSGSKAKPGPARLAVKKTAGKLAQGKTAVANPQANAAASGSLPQTGGSLPQAKVNQAEAAINWTPLLVKQSVSPQLFQGSDEKFNLVYEIALDSWAKGPVTMTELQIVDADKKLVKSLKGPDLQGVLVQIDGSKGTVIKPGASGVIYVNLTFDDESSAPAKLQHRLLYETKGVDGKVRSFVTETQPQAVDMRPPLVIGSPLRGGKWCAFGGYCGVVGHRRTLFAIDNRLFSAQRYAIDWLRLDDEGYSSRGPACKDNPAYGQEVYAVEDAIVYGVKQGFEDQPLGKPGGDERLSFPGGNSITLDLGNGYYGFYAHLKPDSIKVKTGDRVKRGQVIALLGNSGNSTGPHLHFHVTDDPHVLGSNGVPYVFEEFKLLGEIPDLNKFFQNDAASKKNPVSESKFEGVHKKQLVKEGHIVSFDKP